MPEFFVVVEAVIKIIVVMIMIADTTTTTTTTTTNVRYNDRDIVTRTSSTALSQDCIHGLSMSLTLHEPTLEHFVNLGG